MGKPVTVASVAFFFLLTAAKVADVPDLHRSAVSALTAPDSVEQASKVPTHLSPEQLLFGADAILAQRPVPPLRPAAPAEDPYFDLLTAVYSEPQLLTMPDLSPAVEVDEATLWLARCIYSETKLPHEQELVAWVVRNRVETNYRGRSTYRETVLDPYQFSAFNPSHPRRGHYLSLAPDTPIPAWQQALFIAHYVRHADPVYRPFSAETRHFFSEMSMPGRRFPTWAQNHQRVTLRWRHTVDQRRFRFYKAVS
jgi:hypothetical protein